jgi:hypothetical protein
MSYRPTREVYGFSFAWIFWLFVILAFFVVMGFGFDWFAKPMEIFSPERVEMLSRQANDRYQALEAREKSVYSIRLKAEMMMTAYGEEMETWPLGKRDEYLQLRAQETNLILAYNNACAEYKAMWLDEWRSVAAPPDLPTTCEAME